MNKPVKITLWVVGGLFVLGAVGGALGEGTTPPPAPEPSIPAPAPEPSTPAPAPEPSSPAPAPEPTDIPESDPMVEPGDPPREIQLLALQVTWDDMTPAEQDQICEAFTALGPDASVDAFMAGADNTDSQFSRAIVRSFFEEACGL